jgi:hypothetical protein
MLRLLAVQPRVTLVPQPHSISQSTSGTGGLDVAAAAAFELALYVAAWLSVEKSEV